MLIFVLFLNKILSFLLNELKDLLHRGRFMVNLTLFSCINLSRSAHDYNKMIMQYNFSEEKLN